MILISSKFKRIGFGIAKKKLNQNNKEEEKGEREMRDENQYSFFFSLIDRKVSGTKRMRKISLTIDSQEYVQEN